MGKKSNQSPNELKEIIARLEKSELELQSSNQQLEAINQDLIASEISAINREEKYRLLAENIADVIWVYNIDKQIFTYISPSVFQLRGYTVKEVMNQSFTESLIPDDVEKINKLFTSRSIILKKGIAKIYSDELQQTCKDGTNIWVEIVTTPQKAKDGTHEILGVSRNISERKEIENKQRLTNQQLLASDQQLKASNQQLSATESTLKISEERYKGIIDNTFNSIAIYKPIENGNNFVFIDFNKSAEKLENIVKENIIGKKVTDVFPGIEKFGLLDIFKKVTKTGKPEHFPISFYEGDKINGYRENYVFKLSTGELIAVYQDATERMIAKQELQLERDKLTSIFESMDDGVYLINKNYDIEYINNVLKKEFGPIDSKKCFKYFHDANKPCSFCKNEEVFNGKTVQWEWTSSKNNKTYDLIDSPVYNADGSISKLEIFRDITNRKKAENEISKLSTAVEQSPSVIAISDLVGNVEYVNPKFTELSGYSKDEILNHNLRILKSGEQSEKDYAKLWKTIKSGKAWQGEFHNKKKNGELFWEAATISPIFDKDGEIINYLKVAENITERKKTEKELIKLSFAVEQSPSVIAITDLVGNIEYVNPKFTELTGYSIEEAKGLNPRILKSGDQPDEVYAELWKTISQGKAWKGEFHNKKKNGELFWEAAIVSPIFDKNGNKINYLKVAEDITIRKKTEEELKTSEEKYRKLIDTTSEGFWLLDSKNITIDINKALCDMLGYSREDIIGKSPLDFTDKENKIVFTEQLSKARDERHRIYDISLKSKDEKNIPTLFNATSIIKKTGEHNGSFAFVTNISKRKRNEQIRDILYHISNAVNTTSSIEELINHIQKELSKIIDTTNFYVALYNPETDMLSLPYYTDEKECFTYIPAAKTLSKYVIKTKKSLLANVAIKQKLVDEGVLEYQRSLSKLWLGVPLKIGGEVTGVFALQSYTDENAFTESDMKMLEFVSEQIGISIERKKNEQDLNTALYNATESDRLKSAFLATISHELRTPLNAIIGFASLINEELETDDIFEFANTIKSSGSHLLNIVNEIFDITLIESGKSIISKQNVNLNSTLKDIYSTIKAEQSIMKKDNIDVNIIIPPESSKLIVNTDPFKVKQILTNLLKNALKFTNKGYVYYGYVSDVIDNKAVIKFFVRDTGIGIPKDKQEYIFGMFKQIDDSYTRTYGGIGIGLSISKKLTKLLGGNIWFESKEGVGSTFYFTIPKDIVTKSNKSPVKSPINKINLTDKTILIVEDDIDSYEYLKIVLNLSGANILWAQDGEESIDICKQNSSIDIVLMDINMKVMNGYIATREIKKFRPNLPIIAQTALAISGDHKKAIDAGCDDYITKPIKKEELTKMIHKQLNS